MRVPPGPKPYGLGSAILAEYAQAINYIATMPQNIEIVNGDFLYIVRMFCRTLEKSAQRDLQTTFYRYVA